MSTNGARSMGQVDSQRKATHCSAIARAERRRRADKLMAAVAQLQADATACAPICDVNVSLPWLDRDGWHRVSVAFEGNGSRRCFQPRFRTVTDAVTFRQVASLLEES